MPSLRRSLSSPSVRSSPYPPPALSSASTRSRPLPRRSSGSTTADRRVLADIEWWRVHDGQCDHDLPHEPDPEGPTLTLSGPRASLEPPISLGAIQDLYPDAFPALSIAPHSPPGTPHDRDSSVESTPELHSAPLETVQLALTLSCPFGDLYPSSLARAGGRLPLFGLRSVSAPHQSSIFTPDFADMGGDSFSLDQNIFR